MRSLLQFAVAIGVTIACGAAVAQDVNDAPLNEKWAPTEWGPDDKAGAVNRTTPQIVLKAVGLVKQGKVATLGKVYAADATGTLISIFPVTDETVLQTNLTMKDEPLLKLDTNAKVLPAEGTAATLILQVP